MWDRKGQKINSHGFATLLQDKIDHGININFIIGGAHGVSEKLIKTSQLCFLSIWSSITINLSITFLIFFLFSELNP